MFREAVGDLNRLRQIVTIVVKHGFGDLFFRARIFERLKIRKPQTENDRAKAPAERFTRMLTELGPIFIKMGQLLSTRPDILSEEYIQALATLQDNAPPFAFQEVVRIIRDDLGADPEKFFAAIEPEPLASASIAQVHLATTKDGREVVVKVKRPGIEQSVRSSLDVLYYLAHLVEAVVEESTLYEPAEVVRQFDRAIGFEMDFAREAQNLRAFAKSFEQRTTMVIPAPLDDLCGPNVLTMTRLMGKRVADVEPGSELARRASMNLIEGFYQQAFEDGFFHADPHPGNLIVMEDGRVGLIDFGQVGHLSRGQRSTLTLLGLGIVLKDADTVSRIVYRVGSQSRRADLGKLKEDIRETLEDGLEEKLGQIDSGQVLGRLLDLSTRHQVRIPAEFTLAVKALVTIEGIVRKLYPEMEPGQVAAPYVKKLLAEHYSLDDLRGGAGRTLLQLSNLLSEVPQQVSQILMDLEGGRLAVQVRDPESALLRRTLRAAGIDLFWGLVATGLLIGALPAVLSPDPTPAAAIICLLGSGLIATIVTLRYFLAPAMRKMRIRPWLERRWGDLERRRNK